LYTGVIAYKIDVVRIFKKEVYLRQMKKCIFFIFLIIIQVFLSAQVAEEIEKLLETEAINYEQAARFVLQAADMGDENGLYQVFGPGEAFRFAEEKQWLPQNAAQDAAARLDGVSFLIMRSFDVKGGLFYSLFKTPHYAYREMLYQEVIQGKADPGMAVSGDMLLFMINRLLSLREEEIIINAEKEQRRQQAAEEAERRAQERAAAAARLAEEQRLAREINTQLAAHGVTDTSARVTDEGITISLNNIQFMANSAELPEPEKRKLPEIAQILETISLRRILITGHTALAGTVEDRILTSLQRAQAVASYLVSLGARNADEIFVQGFGSERPVADNSTPQGMALNRRVEITILENQ
jgi:outer membrane protein OmpA-like peptidoglycan-associated protein